MYFLVSLSDIIADVIAVHLPVWACVAALHVVLLEVIATKCGTVAHYSLIDLFPLI